jgi:hypothetical protein
MIVWNVFLGRPLTLSCYKLLLLTVNPQAFDPVHLSDCDKLWMFLLIIFY